MAEGVASSQVTIIRESILGYLNLMNNEKRKIEQEIRERNEAIKSQFFAQGATQFSYAQVNDLGTQYRDDFLNFYQNSIHMKLLANSSIYIRKAIEYGFVNSGIVQEEWLEAFNNMQDQINNYENIASQLQDTEQSLLNEKERVTQLEVGATITKSDLAQFENLIAEKDQIIREKEQEILNLSEGLSRMENQVNNMGQNMLQNSMNIEDLQGVIGEKDAEINELQNQLKSTSVDASEVEGLREQLRQSQLRIKELETQASAASTDLVDQLQENLEQARDELLKTRKELVEKNDEIYQVKLDRDEAESKLKRQKESFESIETNYNQLTSEKEKRETEFAEVKRAKEEFEHNYKEAKTELDSLKQKMNTVENELTTAKSELSQYEGKATITEEEHQRFNQQISEMQVQLTKANSTFEYFKKVLSKDVKFKTLIFLDSIGEEVRLDSLSKGIGFPQESVQRAIIELSEDGFASSRKEGRFVYVSKGGHESPFSLEAALA